MTLTSSYSAQNQLPTWIAQSTVSGEATAAHLDSLAKQPVTSSSFSLLSSLSAIDAVSNSNAAASTSKAAENELDSYYASLERAQSLANEAGSIPPSPLFTPIGEGISTPKIETTSEDELDDVVVAAVAALTGAIKMGRGSPLPSSRSGSNSAKRSRDEEEPTMADEIAKKLKQDGDVDIKPMILDGAEDSEAEVLVEDELEDEEDDFEEVDEEDPNPMISVEGKMIPYNQVKDDDDLSAAMVSSSFLLRITNASRTVLISACIPFDRIRIKDY
jgi:transcription initiation factor TFIIE subunit alpha